MRQEVIDAIAEALYSYRVGASTLADLQTSVSRYGLIIEDHNEVTAILTELEEEEGAEGEAKPKKPSKLKKFLKGAAVVGAGAGALALAHHLGKKKSDTSGRPAPETSHKQSDVHVGRSASKLAGMRAAAKQEKKEKKGEEKPDSAKEAKHAVARAGQKAKTLEIKGGAHGGPREFSSAMSHLANVGGSHKQVKHATALHQMHKVGKLKRLRAEKELPALKQHPIQFGGGKRTGGTEHKSKAKVSGAAEKLKVHREHPLSAAMAGHHAGKAVSHAQAKSSAHAPDEALTAQDTRLLSLLETYINGFMTFSSLRESLLPLGIVLHDHAEALYLAKNFLAETVEADDEEDEEKQDEEEKKGS